MAAPAANKRRRRSTDDGLAGLPDDILLEILSRVGNVKDLFRFAVTCRRWLCRFTDPAFLSQLCPGHRARLLGFFFQQTRFLELPRRTDKLVKIWRRIVQHTSVSAPTFLAAPGSPLGTPTTDQRALTAFVSDGDRTFNYAEPLAARRGIVLMRLIPRTFDDLQKMTRATSHFLGLCNPITGERHVLPPLECPDLGRCCDGFAIITAADSDDDLDGKHTPPAGRRFKFSQLLLITITTQIESDVDDDVYLHSYSAATRSWSTPTVCLDGSRFSMAGERSAVVHRGAAHWLCIDIDQPCSPRESDDGDYLRYTLISAKVGNATGIVHAPLTEIPIRDGGSPLLFVSRDGKLSVACVHLLHVTVWTQQGGEGDGDTLATWLRTTVIRMPTEGPNPPLCEPYGKCTWLDFNGGSMLVLPSSGGGVFAFDLEKKVMEKVMDCLLPQKFSSQWNRTCVAYKMDLVEFFVLQLARWSM